MPKVTSAKSLGVKIDKGLTWAPHIEETTKKLTGAIGALKCVQQFVPTTTLHVM